MRVTIVRDGERASAEVADDLGAVIVGGQRYPVKVVARTTSRVELEVAGERVAVDSWPDRYPTPPTAIEVDGERWTVEVEVETSPSALAARRAAAPAAAPTAVPSPAVPGRGIPVLPPMPGKVVELKVHEGDSVARGEVLLVLEAMKMRNEIASPADGIVRGLAVAAGANVRAREPMLYIEPP
ncbi:MAG TPA: biotin/lipoyl-containing protein [Thermoplasmata archaeon]|nr:biotin/lipoyl-containing protein [Thermoplasmata archaeon]